MSKEKQFRCEGSIFRGNNLIQCLRPASHITEELVRYCDICFIEHNEARARAENRPESSYDPDDYNGYIPKSMRSKEQADNA